MQIGPTEIIDTFAEAFRMRYARLIVSAIDDYWLDAACRELCGYGSSVIRCDAEVAVERKFDLDETLDGRPSASVLAFGFSTDALAKAIPNRVGQCVMTAPTSALIDGMPDADERVAVGKQIRYFGDGVQKSKKLGDRRFWRIPVMDGEFTVEESVGVAKGVAGGNIILMGTDQPTTLAAARRAVESIADMPGVITPFPGGVVRSGSKVGSKYPKLVASTNEAFCPTLRGRVESELPADAHCAYEIVVNGSEEACIAQAMTTMMHAAAGEGIVAISAGNYGGKLGKFHFRLRELATDERR